MNTTKVHHFSSRDSISYH